MACSGLLVDVLFANSAGVRLFRLECGLTALYSRRQSSITILASIRFLNYCMLRHSSRRFPLNDSFEPFCHGLPGSIDAVSVFVPFGQRRIALDANPGPLLDRSSFDAPRTLSISKIRLRG